MKVYIVMYDDPYKYGVSDIERVFETEEKAEKYINSQKQKEDYYIEDKEVE